MPLRFIMRYLANNEQLVQKIAESYPVRRTARFCVSLFYRSQNLAKDKIPELDKMNLGSFFNRFKQNVIQGLKEAKQQVKDKEQKHK